MEHIEMTVPVEAAGERLDRFMTQHLELSRSQLRLRIDAGDVLVDGATPYKAGQILAGGEVLTIVIPPPPPSVAAPEDIPLTIVYADADLVVVDKVSGMVVHPSPGHDSGTLVNALLHRYGTMADGPLSEDNRPRPGIVHRLDKETSGLIITARTMRAHVRLSEMLAERTVSRRYLAVVHGPNLAQTGTFDTLHRRHPKDRKRFTSKTRTGKRAVTHWEVLARAKYTALVECRLETGRTHQIRVHFADAGHPIVGDTIYTSKRRAPGSEGRALHRMSRQALHAWKLEFEHPVTGVMLSLHGLPPDDMSSMIEAVFGVEVWEELTRTCSMGQ